MNRGSTEGFESPSAPIPGARGLDRNCGLLALGFALVFRFGQEIVEHLFGEGNAAARWVVIVLYLIVLSVVRTVARPPAGESGHAARFRDGDR